MISYLPPGKNKYEWPINGYDFKVGILLNDLRAASFLQNVIVGKPFLCKLLSRIIVRRIKTIQKYMWPL
jgi:hypothetical protein